jgi:hypothetical protein
LDRRSANQRSCRGALPNGFSQPQVRFLNIKGINIVNHYKTWQKLILIPMVHAVILIDKFMSVIYNNLTEVIKNHYQGVLRSNVHC